MKQWTQEAATRLAGVSFALMIACSAATTGCQIITAVDRSDIASGGNGGGGAGGGAGGMAGAGGGGQCASVQDCPGVDTACRKRTCVEGVCGYANEPSGPAANQLPGDCKRSVCDGMGTVTTENDATDVPGDGNDCTTDACNADMPTNTPTALGAPCAQSSGAVCDGQGACVECNTSTDCTSGLCVAHQCVPATCADGAKNGKETDTDCGGSDCVPCVDGLMCGMATDCQSGVCMNMICTNASCVDMVKNGQETDIDCGGNTCNPCAAGKDCAQNSDCQGGSCSGSKCLPTCTDKEANGNETDVDCGGPLCSPCNTGQTCSIASDCVTGVCSGGKCQLPGCMDGIKNGDETGTDCGGSCMTHCADGAGCSVNGDCVSGVCSMMVCQAGTCSDGIKNGAETDNDCGGGTCPTCSNGKLCAQNADCTSALCQAGICVDATCGDGALTGSETCDDGNTSPGDGCSATCTIDMGYGCSGMPSVCAAICGDGMKLGGEACDDGNMNSGDCCSSTCGLEMGCEIESNDTDATANAWATVAIGNVVKAFNDPALDKDVFSIVVPPNNKGTITAEVKNGPLGSSCTSPAQIDSFLTVRNSAGTTLATNDDIAQPTNYCSLVTVGNLNPGTYFVEARRTPMAPAGLATYDYRLQVDLALEACGDGSINPGELCDDNNTMNGDGCSSACSLEPGWTCSGQPSNCTFTCGNGMLSGNEQCDDGNTMNGDGCSSVCLLETVSVGEPNNTCGQASGPFLPPFVIDEAITPIGDLDYIAITVPAYADLKLETFAPMYGVCTLGNDTVLQLRGTDCNTVLVTDDEDGINSCSLIDSTVMADAAARHLAPGTYYARVEDYLNNGTIAAYKLQVSFQALCGNGVREGSEQCDGTPNCAADCMLLPFCGDGQVANAEQCDDGGTTNGDGCSAMCTAEADYRCTGSPSVCTRYETNCNDGVDNDGDGSMDAADMDCTLPAYFPACMAGQSLRVYKSFDTPKSIPDNNMLGITSKVLVVDNIGTIASSALLLNVTHTWIEDIDVTLVSPSNASFDVTSDNGGSLDNYTNTVFQASCPTVTSGTPPYSNCYGPEASLVPLNGTSAQGAWQLHVVDDTMDDLGTLNNWALALCVVP